MRLYRGPILYWIMEDSLIRRIPSRSMSATDVAPEMAFLILSMSTGLSIVDEADLLDFFILGDSDIRMQSESSPFYLP